MIVSTDNISIVNKRHKKRITELAGLGSIIVDVTSSSDNLMFRKFSPFYPHGNIPVPSSGKIKIVSASVEGVWQGLKVFEKEGIDITKFNITTMKNLKRVVGTKRGSVFGHVIYGAEQNILGYVNARKAIYIPTYYFILNHYLNEEIGYLLSLLGKGHKLVLLDYDVNEDVENTSRPLSHASLIKTYIVESITRNDK
jgi:hypothetical protein